MPLQNPTSNLTPEQIPSNIQFGVSYSQPHATWLFEGTGVDPKEVLTKMAEDLKPSTYRLQAYWNAIQENGPEDFAVEKNIDWQLKTLSNYWVKHIVMCIGIKVPHWPEFHIPNWASKLSDNELQEQYLIYLKKMIQYYANNPAITEWQIENEPFYNFGTRKPFANIKDFLQREIDIVKAEDKLGRQIIITDSGDQSGWKDAANFGDILGVTYYGVSYSNGYTQHTNNISDWKNKIANTKKPVWMIEMQAEPWGPSDNKALSWDETTKSMDPERFKSHLEFCINAGFDKIIPWGAEWWYYAKIKGHPEMWDTAKKFMAK